MDDLCHLFKTSFADVPEEYSIGWNTTKLMVSIFTNFAATGNPGVDGWLPSTGQNQTPPLWGLNIREPFSVVGPFPEKDRMLVWDTFFNYSSTSNISKASYLLSLISFFKIFYNYL